MNGLTLDFQRRSIIACVHESAEINGDVGYFAALEDGGVLYGHDGFWSASATCISSFKRVFLE